MKRYIVIDIGCIECGISSKAIGSYKTQEEADKACENVTEQTGNWRDGGQSSPEVFEIDI